MVTNTVADVFVDLRSAAMRSARNYHRLEHLGRRGTYTFHEETITDLLIAEMAGKEYDVDADCPTCPTSGTCGEWDGAGRVKTRGFRVRALTKVEEGGHRARRQAGANADFVIAVQDQDPDLPGSGPEYRMLVQAKSVLPTGSFLSARERKQYAGLLGAAARSRAVPYYALYVRQPDSHASSPTACPVHVAAADRAIVLIPAGATTDSDLRRMPVADVLAAGRPLRCLGGCRCTGVDANATAWSATAAFVSASFPEYVPAPHDSPRPGGVPRVEINAARYRLARAEPGLRRQSQTDQHGSGEPSTSLLVVRLGRQAPSPQITRTHIGYDPSMRGGELRAAAQGYWRLDPRRATGLTHVVAASGQAPIEAYEILPDSLTYTMSTRGTRRASFELREVEDTAKREQLMRQAAAALARLSRGAQNPVLYAPD